MSIAIVTLDLGMAGEVDAVIDYHTPEISEDNRTTGWIINSVIVTRGIKREPVDISQLPFDDEKLIEIIKEAL